MWQWLNFADGHPLWLLAREGLPLPAIPFMVREQWHRGSSIRSPKGIAALGICAVAALTVWGLVTIAQLQSQML